MLRLISNLHRSRKRNHLATVRTLLADAQRVVFCSGWLKTAGIQALRSELEAAVRRGACITFYSNRPQNKREETEQEAIDALGMLGIEHVAVERDFYLHSKIYYFEAHDRYQAMLGSANITDGGLRRNEEVSVLISGNIGDDTYREVTAYLAHLERRCRRAANRRAAGLRTSQPDGSVESPNDAPD